MEGIKEEKEIDKMLPSKSQEATIRRGTP